MESARWEHVELLGGLGAPSSPPRTRQQPAKDLSFEIPTGLLKLCNLFKHPPTEPIYLLATAVMSLGDVVRPLKRSDNGPQSPVEPPVLVYDSTPDTQHRDPFPDIATPEDGEGNVTDATHDIKLRAAELEPG
ncbi:hypothetical protein OBBRIDRAFT_891005 [Obba rivulosa]|uniref:Uncharacterized protein n=1 Tax=Obba rivulosa TaxID=1052685 RepID=A0A8E2AK55_9APHY|nr:hypothetical protein OBBRIDRAFT_891005 [Obba rivulosa]